MTDPNSRARTAGPDDKTTVLPETAVALVEMERLQQELAGLRGARQEPLGAIPAGAGRRGQRAQARREGPREHAPVRGREIRAGPDRGEGLARARHPQFRGRRASPTWRASSKGRTRRLRLLAKAFEKAQIEEINPEGAPFNPELHEAMMAQPSDAPPNTVLSVVQRGYQLNGRLLRPARVVVSRTEEISS